MYAPKPRQLLDKLGALSLSNGQAGCHSCATEPESREEAAARRTIYVSLKSTGHY
jgi:hypothetical protein